MSPKLHTHKLWRDHRLLASLSKSQDIVTYWQRNCKIIKNSLLFDVHVTVISDYVGIWEHKTRMTDRHASYTIVTYRRTDRQTTSCSNRRFAQRRAVKWLEWRLKVVGCWNYKHLVTRPAGRQWRRDDASPSYNTLKWWRHCVTEQRCDTATYVRLSDVITSSSPLTDRMCSCSEYEKSEDISRMERKQKTAAAAAAQTCNLLHGSLEDRAYRQR